MVRRKRTQQENDKRNEHRSHNVHLTDNIADRVLPFGEVTENKEKADPSHFLKVSLGQPQKRHMGFCPDATSPTFSNCKAFTNTSKIT